MGTKKIDILYGGDLCKIQGINYVTNSFVKGKRYFENYNLYLNKVYSPTQIINVFIGDELPIGKDISKVNYKTKRRIRTILRKMLSSNISLFAWFKFYMNILKPAKDVVKKYISVKGDADYLIFQNIFTAYYYYKKVTKKQQKKSIVILHSGENIFTQLKKEFHGIFKNNKLEKKVYNIYNYVFDNIDKVVFISKNALVNNNDNINIGNKDFVYNGVPDLSDITLQKKPVGKTNIVCVGSISGWKGQDVIIEALNLLNNDIKEKIHMYFIGGGTQINKLKQRVKNYNLEHLVTFMGARNDVDELLTNMDIFILPSISEGLPMSIIEALRQGLYILVTDTGGTKEMIGEGFGEIITRDPENIKNTITSLIINNTISLDSKQKARKHYLNNFSLELMIIKYAQILKSL
jgi:glycosyltransferase involved in cell wall biosynthesis